MLTPQYRLKAVSILAQHNAKALASISYYNNYTNTSDTGVSRVLEVGFPGYATFSNEALVRELNQIRAECFDAQNLLNELADDILLK